jgi:hypothetical protein
MASVEWDRYMGRVEGPYMGRLETPGTPGVPPDPQEPPLAPHDPVDPGPRDSRRHVLPERSGPDPS